MEKVAKKPAAAVKAEKKGPAGYNFDGSDEVADARRAARAEAQAAKKAAAEKSAQEKAAAKAEAAAAKAAKEEGKSAIRMSCYDYRVDGQVAYTVLNLVL